METTEIKKEEKLDNTGTTTVPVQKTDSGAESASATAENTVTEGTTQEQTVTGDGNSSSNPPLNTGLSINAAKPTQEELATAAEQNKEDAQARLDNANRINSKEKAQLAGEKTMGTTQDTHVDEQKARAAIQAERLPVPPLQGVTVPDATPTEDPDALTIQPTGQKTDSGEESASATAEDFSNLPLVERQRGYDQEIADIKKRKFASEAERQAAIEAAKKKWDRTKTVEENKEEVRQAINSTYKGTLRSGYNGELYGKGDDGNPIKVATKYTDADGNEFTVINLKGRKFKINEVTGEMEEWRDEPPADLDPKSPDFKEWYANQRRAEATQTVTNYFDTDGGVNGSLFNGGMTGDNLRTILGPIKLAALQRKYGLNFFTDPTGNKTLALLKNEYRAERLMDAEAGNGIRSLLNDVKITEDVPVGKNADGSVVYVPADQANKFWELYKKYNIDVPDDMKFRRSDADTRLMQTTIYDIIESNPALFEKAKEVFPNDFDKDGNLLRVNIDGHDGQKTSRMEAWLLSMIVGDDLLANVGKRYNPESGEMEDLPIEDTYLADYLNEEQIKLQEDFERKRNERQKSLAALGSIVMTIGDTIGTANGLKAADRSKIHEVQDNLEKKYYEIKSDYDKRLDELRKEREQSRSDREKHRMDVYEKVLEHRQDKEMLNLQQTFQEAENAKNRALQASEGNKNRDLKWRLAQLDKATREAIAAAKSPQDLSKSFYRVNINGQMYWYPKTQKGMEATILNSALPGGWRRENLINAISKNGKADANISSLIQNALGDTFPNASGELKLDINNVVKAINNLKGLIGKPGIDNEKVEMILKNFDDNLVKQGAFTDGQMTNLIGAGSGGQDSVEDEENDGTSAENFY